MVPSLRIFDIPHIQTAITADLTFSDLQNCAIVSRTWYRDFNPILWQQFHSYRSSPHCKNYCEVVKYKQVFTTFNGWNTILRHCFHIHSLSVRGTSLIRVLAGTHSECVNLREIRFATDIRQERDLGLHHLVVLMDRNPHLSSLRLSHIETPAPHDEQDLRDFVDRLSLYPILQRVQIEARIRKGLYGYKSRSKLSTLLVCEMIVKLMQFKDSVTIETDLQPLSSAEPSCLLNPIPGVQMTSSFGKIHEVAESVDSYRVQDLSLTIRVSKELDIVLAILIGSYKKYPRLKRLHLDNEYSTSSQLLVSLLTEPFTHIQVLEINCRSISRKLVAIFRACKALVSVTIPDGGMESDEQKALRKYHGKTLGSLVMKGMEGACNIVGILVHCPRLHTYIHEPRHFYPSEIDRWNPTKFDNKLQLQTLKIAVLLRPIYLSLLPWETQRRQQNKVFFGCIGRLVGLRCLSVRVVEVGGYVMDLDVGIECLGGLTRLESLTILSQDKYLSESMVQRMIDMWPALVNLHVEVFSSDPLPEYVDRDTGTLKLKRSNSSADWDTRPPIAYMIPVEKEPCELCYEDLDDWRMHGKARWLAEKKMERSEMMEEEYLRTWKGR